MVENNVWLLHGTTRMRQFLRTLTRCAAITVFLIFTAVGSFHNVAAQNSFLTSARDYYEDGDFAAALIETKNALQTNPNDAQARFLLGKIHLRLGDAQAAEASFLRARELGLTGEELELALAYARIELRRYEEVTERISENLQSDSELQRDLLAARGEALIGLGQFEEADATFERVLRSGPHLRALVGRARIGMALDDQELARQYLDQAKAMGVEAPELLAAEAMWLMNERDFEGAKERLARAIQLDPSRLALRFAQIQAHAALGELDEAEEIVQTLREAGVDSLILTLQDAIIKFLRGEFQSAKAAADQVLTVDENQPQALLIAGHSAYRLNDLEQARSRLSAYLARRPQDERARMMLGATMLKLGYPEDALSTLRTPGAALPDNSDYLEVLTGAAFAAGDRKAAVTYLERLARKNPNDAGIHERLGLARMAIGDHVGGAEALERAIALEPDRRSAYTRLFAIYLQQDPQKALEVAQALKVEFPTAAAGDMLLGLAHLSQGNRAEAHDAFARAVDKDPANIEAAGNLAGILILDGDLERARAVLDSALDREPGSLRLLLMYAELEANEGRLAKAMELLTRAVSHNEDSVEARNFLARLLLDERRFSEAIDVLQPIASDSSRSIDALALLGSAQLNAGDYPSAVETFGRLRELRPDDASVIEGLMFALEGTGNISEALAVAREALAVAPDSFRVRFARARYLAELGQLDEAKSALESLRESRPDRAEIDIVESRIALAEQRPNDAIAILERVWQTNRNNFVLTQLVQALVAGGQVPEAKEILRNWLNEYPNDLLSLTALAELFIISGDMEKAEAQYREILSKFPDHNQSIKNLMVINAKNGAIDRAIELGRNALARQPDNSTIAGMLALVLLESGRAEEAVQVLERTRAVDPRNPSLGFQYARALARTGEARPAIDVLEDLLAQTSEFPERANAEELLRELVSDDSQSVR